MWWRWRMLPYLLAYKSKSNGNRIQYSLFVFWTSIIYVQTNTIVSFESVIAPQSKEGPKKSVALFMEHEFACSSYHLSDDDVVSEEGFAVFASFPIKSCLGVLRHAKWTHTGLEKCCCWYRSKDRSCILLHVEFKDGLSISVSRKRATLWGSKPGRLQNKKSSTLFHTPPAQFAWMGPTGVSKLM